MTARIVLRDYQRSTLDAVERVSQSGHRDDAG